MNTFELKTYDSNSLILYSDQTNQYLELSFENAKLAFGEIENLDGVTSDDGGWVNFGIPAIQPTLELRTVRKSI